MAWSVDDLSLITDLLIGELKAAIAASPIWTQSQFAYEVSGAMPEAARDDGTNVLSLYLLHVGRDAAWRNTPVSGSRAQLNAAQPLSLSLSYLLTAYAGENWMLEQQLMSIALWCFHATPIFQTPTLEFTVTVEADSIEEMSRLWQAIAAPIRLSSMFRVAVVFLAPPLTPVADSRTPDVVNVSVAPDLGSGPSAAGAEPQLYDLAAQMTFAASPEVTANAEVDAEFAAALAAVTVASTEAVAIAGGSVRVRGTGLDVADALAVYVRQGGSEWVATGWRVPSDTASGVVNAADELVLALPSAYGEAPAPGQPLLATPLPGIYQLAVGNAATAQRSNALALAIGPLVTGIGNGTPVLTPDVGGNYTFHVSGLVAGQTSVLLDTVSLNIGAAAGAGVAVVDAAAGTIGFQLPAPTGFPSGAYARVRVLVNAVEAPPGWWVRMP